MENSIHYILSVTDFNQKKIEKYKFPYTNRIPIGIVRDTLPAEEMVTILLKDKSGIAVLYRKIYISTIFFILIIVGAQLVLEEELKKEM